MLYGQSYDHVLEALPGRKFDPVEFLTTNGLLETMDTFQEQYMREKNEAKRLKGLAEIAAGVAGVPASELPEPGRPSAPTGLAMGLTKLAQHLTSQAREKVMEYQRHVQTMVENTVTFVEETLTDAVLSTRIATSRAGMVRGDGEGKYVIVVYDTKVSGEANSWPQQRPPSWRQAHHKKLMTATMHSRSEKPEELHAGDLYVFFNGLKHGVDGNMVRNFVKNKVKYQTKQGYIYVHRGVNERPVQETSPCRGEARGRNDHHHTTPLAPHGAEAPQLCGEQLRICSRVCSAAHALGCLCLEAASVAEKSLFGSVGFVSVGGAAPAGTTFEEAEAGDKDTPLPAFYHAMPGAVAEDLVRSHDAQAVIDLTAGDGAWALTCIRNRIPYTGVVFTIFHGHALKSWLEVQVLQAMQDENDPLYVASFMEALAGGRANGNPRASPERYPVGSAEAQDDGEANDDEPPRKKPCKPRRAQGSRLSTRRDPETKTAAKDATRTRVRPARKKKDLVAEFKYGNAKTKSAGQTKKAGHSSDNEMDADVNEKDGEGGVRQTSLRVAKTMAGTTQPSLRAAKMLAGTACDCSLGGQAVGTLPCTGKEERERRLRCHSRHIFHH